MSNEQQRYLDEVEMLLAQERLSPDDQVSVQQLVDAVKELRAENKRLRSALVKANSKKPKMSTRLKEALYE